MKSMSELVKESIEMINKVRKPNSEEVIQIKTVLSEAGYMGAVGTAIATLIGTVLSSGIGTVLVTAAWVAGLWKGMEWAFPQLTARTRKRALLAGLIMRAMLDETGKKPSDLTAEEQAKLVEMADRLAIQLERAGKYRI